MPRTAVLVLGLLVGCAYVSRAELDARYDADGDGFAFDEDCDDGSDQVYPGAPDVRGDGCDADCGFEPDADGDDWPDAADCAPDDPEIFPCSAREVDGDEVDHDCDGFDAARSDACPVEDPYDPLAESPANCGGGR